MQMADYLAVLNCFLEVFCTIEIAEALSVDHSSGRKRNYVLLLAADGFLSFGVYFWGWWRALLLLNYILIFLYVVRTYSLHINKFDAYLYVFFSTLAVSVLEVVYYIPVHLVSVALGLSYDSTIVVTAIMTLSCHYIRKKDILFSVRKGLRYWSRKSYIYAALFCLFFIGMTMAFKFNHVLSFSDGLYIICFAGAFGGFVQKMSISEMELDLHRKYTEKYTEMIRDIRSRQHKFSNQLNAVYLLFEIYTTYDELVEKQKEELENLQRYLMPNKILILEKPMIIAHLYEKICQAEERGITLELDLTCSLDFVHVPDIYLIEIIGNMLDNAMEEVLARGLEEEIILSISSDGNKCCISVSNEHSRISYEEYQHFFDPGFSSRGKDRGQGLPYIRRIVNRYGGSVSIGNTEIRRKNYFSVSVYI